MIRFIKNWWNLVRRVMRAEKGGDIRIIHSSAVLRRNKRGIIYLYIPILLSWKVGVKRGSPHNVDRWYWLNGIVRIPLGQFATVEELTEIGKMVISEINGVDLNWDAIPHDWVGQ